ncbi:hypothetical protein Y032_0013g2147 [Ancylostoma ceylanicum]|uniref:Potassium channel tetramerisation-type BTB domain-containing protein n=1 Tax=Ancylostoma ceylanicum TaxID=53326 RepID=A0A016VB22_9BILA|nr:hypothetical protein Y032_0013g2147 [Ancylostoma ceylanicum]
MTTLLFSQQSLQLLTGPSYGSFLVLPENQTISSRSFFLDRDPDCFRVLLNGLRYLVQNQTQPSRNGTIESTCSEENVHIGKESRGIWHRFRGK